MKYILLYCLMVAALAGGCARMSESDKLRSFFNTEWEYGLKSNPFRATRVGDRRYDALIPDGSPDAILKQQAHSKDALKRLRQIDRGELGPDDRLNYDLYRYNLETGIAGYAFRNYLMPVTQMGGVYSAGVGIARIAPKKTVKNLDDMLARLRQVPQMIRWTAELMQQGAAAGITPPRTTLVKVEELISAQITDDPRQSPVFETAFKDVDTSVAEADLNRIKDECAAIIGESIIPALRGFRTFWVQEYFPQTRESIAFGDLPNGRAWYNYLIKKQTTLDLSAEAIHAIGIDEVKNITAQMETVKRRAGFSGSLAEYKKHLYADPGYFCKSEEELMAAARAIAAHIDPQLPTLFGTLPELPYKLEPVPAHMAKTAPAAYFIAGNAKNGTPGVFYVNTYDLPSRPVWQLQVLVAHEAVPGHHLQIALAGELDGLPEFRKYLHYGSYTEGWGLYSESLGYDLGLYTAPADEFGRWSLAMWRAVRLVVDTGLHALGWSRERAITYFMEHTGKTRYEAEVEIDRYLVWPGQALTYKLGERVMSGLRLKAESELGERFDVQAFHDVVLGGRALPLPVLEKRVDVWIKKRS